MTQKHINFALAIILILGWFMPFGYYNKNEDISFYTHFYEALFDINTVWISILLFIVTGSILGFSISYILTYFDNFILRKKWFKLFLLFSTICTISSFSLFHFEYISLNLFFYVYHLLFYYFAYRVLKEIKSQFHLSIFRLKLDKFLIPKL